MKIIGFYKNWSLVDKEGVFYVVDATGKNVLFKGTEDAASKVFIMLSANFINEEGKRV